MNIQDEIRKMSTENLKILTQAKTAEELLTQAEKLHIILTPEDAKLFFEALYPIRGKEELSDDDLEHICGGYVSVNIDLPGFY